MEEQIPAKIACAESAEEALRGADIICTATTATRPVFDDSQIKPGTHINGVGSYTLKMIEIPPQTVSRSGVFVDSYSAIMEEAGEIVASVKQKLIDPSQLTEIGAVVMGTRNGRKSQDQITFFKSVGIAVQDAVAARLAIQNAREKGLGQSVRW
jgi:ornithine cyclodeaminase